MCDSEIITEEMNEAKRDLEIKEPIAVICTRYTATE